MQIKYFNTENWNFEVPGTEKCHAKLEPRKTKYTQTIVVFN